MPFITALRKITNKYNKFWFGFFSVYLMILPQFHRLYSSECIERTWCGLFQGLCQKGSRFQFSPWNSWIQR